MIDLQVSGLLLKVTSFRVTAELQFCVDGIFECKFINIFTSLTHYYSFSTRTVFPVNLVLTISYFYASLQIVVKDKKHLTD